MRDHPFDLGEKFLFQRAYRDTHEIRQVMKVRPAIVSQIVEIVQVRSRCGRLVPYWVKTDSTTSIDIANAVWISCLGCMGKYLRGVDCVEGILWVALTTAMITLITCRGDPFFLMILPHDIFP